MNDEGIARASLMASVFWISMLSLGGGGEAVYKALRELNTIHTIGPSRIYGFW